MSDLLPEVLKHLEALVSFDTRNPPRDIGTGGAMIRVSTGSGGVRLLKR